MANKPGYEEDSVMAFSCNVLETPGRGRDPSIPRRNLENLQEWERKSLSQELKGLKIRFERPDHNKRDYRANGVGPDALQKGTVVTDQGNFSLVEYYRQTYKYVIKNPRLPSLHVGNVDRKIYLPMELCK